MKIKVCGMREIQNIKEVLALKPNFMGFIFYPKSSRYVKDTAEIAKIDFGNTQKVAVFVNENIDIVSEKAESIKADFLQLHGEESPEYCEVLQAKGKKIIKTFLIHKDFRFSDLKKYESVVNYFLFDTASKTYGGSGKKFDWTILEQYNSKIPFFLSGGIDEASSNLLTDFYQKIKFEAIDINSRFENSPALKNVIKLEKFMSKIRNNIEI